MIQHHGFVKDVGGESNTYASKYYAKQVKEDLEQSSKIFWQFLEINVEKSDLIMYIVVKYFK